MKTKSKRLTAFLLTVGLAATYAVCPAAYAGSISNLRIEGNPVIYDVLTAQFDYDKDKSALTYQWMVSDSASGEYSLINDTCIDEAGKIRLLQGTDWGEKEYVIYNTSLEDPVTVTPIVAAGMHTSLRNKYVKVSVTDTEGISYESEPVQIKDTWGDLELRDGTVIEGAREKTDPAYVFTVGGQEFILLDTFENDDSGRYLVMAKDTYGVRQYYLEDGGQRPFEMAWWLNNTFKNNGIDGKKLPEEITSNIDYDRYWRLEQGAWWHNPGTFGNGDGKQYRHVSVQGGIMLPAYSELLKYKDIVGLHDNNANWYLRTPCAKFSDGSQADGNWVMRIKDSGNDLKGTHGRAEPQNIRPIFALSKDFFKNVKVSGIGDKVAERIRMDVSDQELLDAGYSQLEIDMIFNGTEAVTNVYMDGIFEYYQTIDGIVEFADDSFAEDASYKWLYSDSKDGVYTELAKNDYIRDNQMTIVEGMTVEQDAWFGDDTIWLRGLDMPLGGKWLKYVVTVAGKDYESEPEQIALPWHDEALYTALTADDTYKPYSSGADSFKIGGKNFILLDTTKSSKSHFYLFMTDKTTDYIAGASQDMHPTLMWLAGEFADTYIPKEVLDYTNPDHYWKLAPRYYGRSNDNVWQPSIRSRIGLLSRAEYIKYHEKIGYNDGLIDGMELEDPYKKWWLIDPSIGINGDGDGIHAVSMLDGSVDWWAREAVAIRPAMYVDSEFFLKTKINLAEAGVNVIGVLREEYTRDEMLAAGYSEEELCEYFDKQYTVDSIAVFGEPKMDSELSVSYNYNGESGTEDVRWYIADAADGEYSELSRGTSVKIAFEQIEKYIKAGITVPGGEVFYSEPLYIESPYDESFEGTLSSLSVAGVPEYYQQLSAGWSSDNGVTDNDIIRTEWLVSDSADGAYSIETSEDKFYPTEAHNGKYVKVKVVLKNRNVYESEPVALSGERWTSQHGYIDNDSFKLSSVNKETPRENIFAVDGQEFILLDSKDYGYYVLSKNSVGNKNLYYCNAMGQAQSPADIMMWLNNKASEKAFKDNVLTDITTNDYTESGYIGNNAYKQLPKKIFDNINYDFFHKVERGTWWHADGFSSLAIQGGLTLLSQEELVRYADKIGLQDEEKTWWMRTPFGMGMDGNHMLAVPGDTARLGQTINDHAATGLHAIRPSFWLSKDFFEKVKLDYAGANVAAAIREVYSKDAMILTGLYTETELDSILGYSGISAIATESGAEITLTAFGGESSDIYLADYSEDGRLLAIDKKTVVPELVNGSYKIQMTTDISEGVSYQKIFIWNNSQKSRAGAVEPVKLSENKDTPYITLRFAGDSTVANYGAGVQSGWGERLADRFDRTVITSKNYALGGRTAAGFIEEGVLSNIISEIQPQDYLFVQFGHNEYNGGVSVDSYKAALQQYIDSVPDKSKVILVTPPVRRDMKDGEFIGSSKFVHYAVAMREVAEENGVALADLHARSTEWITSIPYEDSEDYYMPNDDQHFTHKGSILMTQFIAEELERIGHPLAEYLAK